MAVRVLIELSFQPELSIKVSQRRTAFGVFRPVNARLKRKGIFGKPIAAVAQFFALLQQCGLRHILKRDNREFPVAGYRINIVLDDSARARHSGLDVEEMASFDGDELFLETSKSSSE